eukprot:4871667-Alexandrium_andersonii.AAC.1
MVQARKHQTLHLVLLDWATAFDRLKPAEMLKDLVKLGLPETSASLLESLLYKPVFRVAMNGVESGWKRQSTG